MPTIILKDGEDWLERYKRERARPSIWSRVKAWQWMLLGAILLAGFYYFVWPWLLTVNWSNLFSF